MRRALVVMLPLLVGCDQGFAPETLVNGLRVLGVRSTPADLHPGELTHLDALVLDTSRPGQKTTVLWVGCDADPYNLNRSPCADPATLSDPSAVTGGMSEGTPPEGVHLIGFGDRAVYQAPATLFDVLPQDDPRRQSGTVGLALAFAIGEDVPPTATQEELQAVFGRVKRDEVAWLLTLFRVRISENAERNHNPTGATLTAHGQRQAPGARLLLWPGQDAVLDLEVPDDTFEPYTDLTPDGPLAKHERVLAAWYSNAGRFSEARTALREGVKTTFTAPGGPQSKDDPVPAGRRGSLWTVLRDTRGGNAWTEWPYFVCDQDAETPHVIGVESGATLTLSGDHLDAIVDVIVGGHAAQKGAFNAVTGKWEGLLPTLPPGTHAVEITGQRCTRELTGLTVVVP